MSCSCDGNAGALGDSLLALTSQRVLMELVINPLLSVTGRAACLCIRALGSFVVVLLGGPRGGKYTKRIVVINHVKLKPVAASASFFYFFHSPQHLMPSSSSLISSASTMAGGGGSRTPVGRPPAASDDLCRYLSSNRS